MLRSNSLRISLGVILATAATGASTAHAANRYVAETGSDTSDCSSSAAPCLTIQYGIDQAVSGDTVHVDAGTYTASDPTGVITVNKGLTLLGAQGTLLAPARWVGDETVIVAPGGIAVSASGLWLSGFRIQDSTNPNGTGFGILLEPGAEEALITNNIFQDNIAGIGISNVGTAEMLISYNVFQNNNAAGPHSGSGIYTDEKISVAELVILYNHFTNHNFAAIALASQGMDKTAPDMDFLISGNTMDGCLHGIILNNTHGSNVVGNKITNTNMTPPPGDMATAIGIYGGNSDTLVAGNDLETGIGYGIHLVNSTGPNSNIQVNQNNIVGFGLAGLLVDDAPDSAGDYATCNWWGDVSGPTNPTLNPDGTGDAVVGNSLVASIFNPWLTAPSPNGKCGEPTPPVPCCGSAEVGDAGCMVCMDGGTPVDAGVDASDAASKNNPSTPPCCKTDGGITLGAEIGNANCVVCTDGGSSADAGIGSDAANSTAKDSDNTVQDQQGSSGNNPAVSTGDGTSASSGGCQMGSGTSNAGLPMAAGLLAMAVAGAARRRQKAVRDGSNSSA
ncbi:MAG: right-handed parallel beta-helix repeat-containing protein [Polyangiaceae bacterium]|nr:right-handed parallel beta-helix repeat-containing protein [Polyangiaceae bacterium]